MLLTKEYLLRIKEQLDIDQIFDLLTTLGGNPIKKDENTIISQTICHNGSNQGSYKLYFYQTNHMFKCYTGCSDSLFDLYDLVKKVKNENGELTKNGKSWDYFSAALFVLQYFGYEQSILAENFDNTQFSLHDWQILNNYEKNSQVQQEQIVEMRTFDNKILQYLPHPRIPEWEQEGIKWEVMQHRGIAYDPKNDGIVIPHYDMDGNLIGVRERTLIKEEEKNGKYKPAKINNQMYNHPLSFNLYNLNNSKNNIKIMKRVIVFEGKR